MSVIDCIIDGLEAELELERELGVRFVECDRTLLSPPVCASAAAPPPPPHPVTEKTEPVKAAAAPVPPDTVSAPDGGVYDFVFLHDRALSPPGAEMVAKITAAMKRTQRSAPLVTAAPPPRARIYVVLGGNALKKFFPGMRGAPGQWNRDPAGRQVLVTYSPEYILRFGEDSAAVKKIKQEMWLSLKTVLQRLQS